MVLVFYIYVFYAPNKLIQLGSLGTASGMMGMTQDEYNAYLETKQAQIGKQSSITLPLAMNTGNNGTFKMASESGKAGGRYGSPGQRPNSGKGCLEIRICCLEYSLSIVLTI